MTPNEIIARALGWEYKRLPGTRIDCWQHPEQDGAWQFIDFADPTLVPELLAWCRENGWRLSVEEILATNGNDIRPIYKLTLSQWGPGDNRYFTSLDKNFFTALRDAVAAAMEAQQ